MSDDATIKLAATIMRRVTDLLAPLDQEMKIMQWPSEYRSILWEAVMIEAGRRLAECQL